MYKSDMSAGFYARIKALATGKKFAVVLIVFAVVTAASVAYDVAAHGVLYALGSIPSVLEVVGLLMFRSACFAEKDPPRTSGLTMVYVVQIVTGALSTLALVVSGITVIAISSGDFAYLLDELKAQFSGAFSDSLGLTGEQIKRYIIIILFGAAAVSALYFTFSAFGAKRVRDSVRNGYVRRPVPAGLITLLIIAAVLQAFSTIGTSGFLRALVYAAGAAKFALFAYCGYRFNKEFPVVPM